MNNNRHTDSEMIRGAKLIAQNGFTVRKAADMIGISKSTLHLWIQKELPQVDTFLYYDVIDTLQANLAERHLRGGMSTKKKYEAIRSVANA